MRPSGACEISGVNGRESSGFAGRSIVATGTFAGGSGTVGVAGGTGGGMGAIVGSGTFHPSPSVFGT